MLKFKDNKFGMKENLRRRNKNEHFLADLNLNNIASGQICNLNKNSKKNVG